MNIKHLSVFLLSALALFALPAHSQTRQVNGLNVLEGNTLYMGLLNGVPSDSLQVTDTIAYNVSVSHTHAVDPFITWEWVKVGSGNPTVTANFFESNDNVNWFAIPKGVAQSAYSKTFSPTATTWFEVNFRADTASYSGKYLRVEYITNSTASTKGRVYTILKTSIR